MKAAGKKKNRITVKKGIEPAVKTTERPEPGCGRLSVCIIALNEEKNLPTCLAGLGFADEVIIIDGGSIDRTVEVGRKLGARVIERTFDGFVNQRNFALSTVKSPWILIVDADEVVTPGLQEEICKIINDPDLLNIAYRIPRMSYYLGQWIHYSGWYPDYNIRLLRNGSGSYTGGMVHESLQVEGKVGTCRNHLEHYSYETVSDHLLRIDQYSTLIAQDRFIRGKKSGITWAILKAVMKFFLMYFYRFGFLDGRAGLVIAVLGSYYNFLKYVKLWELNRGIRPVRDIKFGRDYHP